MDLKKANPGFPILVREAEGVAPRLIARYGEMHKALRNLCMSAARRAGPMLSPPALAAMGQERAVGVSGLNKEQVTAELEKLIANKA